MTEFKCVPVDPTSEMLQAANAGGIDTIVAMKAWVRMLASSPAHDGEVVAVVESNDNGDKWAELTDGHDGCGKHLSDGTKLYAHTAPPRVVDEVPQCVQAMRVQQWLCDEHDLIVPSQDIEDAMNNPLPPDSCVEIL